MRALSGLGRQRACEVAWLGAAPRRPRARAPPPRGAGAAPSMNTLNQLSIFLNKKIVVIHCFWLKKLSEIGPRP